MSLNTQQDSANECEIAKVIARHYGDGGVYLPRTGDRRETLRHAIADGFVSQDGFITRKGRRLLARA